MTFEILLIVAAFLGAAIASTVGFGIGSILTPLLALQVGTKVAVAAVSIPHVLATALRFWLLRQHVDRNVLVEFGIPSVIGGLVGALLHSVVGNPALSAVFAMLLLFVGLSELIGTAQHLRFGRRTAWIAGLLSGLLGGLIGNQGGIRSAGLFGFDLPRDAFVATATGIGLLVDAVRLPVYVAGEVAALGQIWPTIALTSIAVVAGTVAGERMLRQIPEDRFRPVVAMVLVALGGFMLYQTFR